MKKTIPEKSKAKIQDIRPEYRFDYSKSRKNRFASKASQVQRAVILDSDVAEVFSTSKLVNNALRGLLVAMPSKQ